MRIRNSLTAESFCNSFGSWGSVSVYALLSEDEISNCDPACCC